MPPFNLLDLYYAEQDKQYYYCRAIFISTLMLLLISSIVLHYYFAKKSDSLLITQNNLLSKIKYHKKPPHLIPPLKRQIDLLIALGNATPRSMQLTQIKITPTVVFAKGKTTAFYDVLRLIHQLHQQHFIEKENQLHYQGNGHFSFLAKINAPYFS